MELFARANAPNNGLRGVQYGEQQGEIHRSPGWNKTIRTDVSIPDIDFDDLYQIARK